jgi:hypothetical protein
MEPQLISRGVFRVGDLGEGGVGASMEPQLISRGVLKQRRKAGFKFMTLQWSRS